MYMRLPVSCSIASETEATSTRRNWAINSLSDEGVAVDEAVCARSVRTPLLTPQAKASTANGRAILPKLANLFISSSWLYTGWLYTGERTLTPFAGRWEVERGWLTRAPWLGYTLRSISFASHDEEETFIC